MSDSDLNANEVNETSNHTGPTRREILQGSLAVAGSVLASSVAPPALLAEANMKRPNLVFFLGEGQRADALSIAGNQILKTPNHDLSLIHISEPTRQAEISYAVFCLK